MTLERVCSFLRTKNHPQMLGGIQRFGAIGSKPLLDRGTVRRRGLIVILEFAFEREKLLLHIFSFGSEGKPERPAERARSARAASLARRVEDINGRWPLRACETWKETVNAADGTLAL
jgi:hypothetical protein